MTCDASGKVCPHCDTYKLWKCFYLLKKGTRHYICNVCEGLRKKALVGYSEYRKRYRKQNKQDQRRLIIESLGGKCWCCGEKREVFLAIDHINNDGSTETRGSGNRRKGKRSTHQYYLFIIRQGIPKDRYRILCHNCNMAIGILGFCPHHPRRTKSASIAISGLKRVI